MMTKKELQIRAGVIGKSKAINDLLDIVIQVAPSDVTVLLQGESGVGKEVFARAVHMASKRSDKRLVSVNCGAIPETLLESELFGHVKGSYTGAVNDRKGYFEIADGGTLFLDEIAEMPLTTQVKFLRVLETHEFMKLGSEKTTHVDVRIIAAANKDLQHEVENKRFRSDLFFRLKAVTLYIPPLRDRKEDIIPLTEHFLIEFAEKNKTRVPQIMTDGYNALLNYNWPGNIRELKNVIESAIALSKNGYLRAEDFEVHFARKSKIESNLNLPVHMGKSADELDRELIYRALIEIKKDLNELKELAYNANKDNKPDAGFNPNEMEEIIPVEELERRAIENALIKTRWNKRKAAKLLGINERTFYRKLKDYDINPYS
jgi:transcriptional regulator with GAF, ATPase, and Fis domain